MPTDAEAQSAAVYVREACPFCNEGRALVYDGTAFPASVVCHYCAGRGHFLVERQQA